MYTWEAIEQSLTFVEEHLTEEIYTKELANIVGLSPFCFQRLFRQLVSRPVQEYVRLRRLTRMIEDVSSTKQRVLGVALNCGFISHTNLTRAFEETYGTTSEEYRRDLPMLNAFDGPEVSMNYVLVDEEVPPVVENIVLEIQRETLAKPEVYLGLEVEIRISEQTSAGENTGVDVPGQLWKRYHTEKASVTINIDANVEMGMSHIQDATQGLFTYLAGSLIQNIPHRQQEYFIEKRLAVGDYIACKVETENLEDLVTDALNQGGKYLFDTWLPHHNLTMEPFSAEGYYRDLGDMAYVEIWVKPLPLENKR